MKQVFTVFVCLVISARAQQQISGRVSDFSGDDLPGVNLVINGTANRTVTDASRTYQIVLRSPDRLSHVQAIHIAGSISSPSIITTPIT